LEPKPSHGEAEEDEERELESEAGICETDEVKEEEVDTIEDNPSEDMEVDPEDK
jgi:hypothetical protein